MKRLITDISEIIKFLIEMIKIKFYISLLYVVQINA